MAVEYVVEGATLECSMGVARSKLLVPQSHGIELCGKNRANVGDAIPIANIAPFGACKVTTPPKPCSPVCIKWSGGKTDTLLDGLPALLSTDKLICSAGGGVIKITDSGQRG